MDQLEFALVAIGIVLGYGVTIVLSSRAHIIRKWRPVERFPILFFSATALSIFFMYMNFSGLWAYRNVEFEPAAGIFNVVYLFAITGPILLFMLAVSVLIPSNVDGIADLERHYAASALAFHLIMAIAVAASLLPDPLPDVSFASSLLGSLIFATIYAFMRGLKAERYI